MELAKDILEDKSKKERAKFYAEAPRATAGRISQIEGGKFVDFWVGKLRGRVVSMNDGWRWATKDEALDCARRFRENAKKVYAELSA